MNKYDLKNSFVLLQKNLNDASITLGIIESKIFKTANIKAKRKTLTNICKNFLSKQRCGTHSCVPHFS